jgi:HPt (histidine-containing phosphotransfer) domain-containing protein
MQGDREKCLEAGMDDYVSKPIMPHLLAEVLERWLPEETAESGEGTPEGADTPVSVAPGKTEALVFDNEGLVGRLMGDLSLVGRVAEAFLADIPKQIKLLKLYLKAGDAACVERQAHTIKGASANVGGEILRGTALEIEKMARAGDLEAVTAGLPELESQFTRLKRAMNRFNKQNSVKRRKQA